MWELLVYRCRGEGCCRVAFIIHDTMSVRRNLPRILDDQEEKIFSVSASNDTPLVKLLKEMVIKVKEQGLRLSFDPRIRNVFFRIRVIQELPSLN